MTIRPPHCDALTLILVLTIAAAAASPVGASPHSQPAAAGAAAASWMLPRVAPRDPLPLARHLDAVTGRGEPRGPRGAPAESSLVAASAAAGGESGVTRGGAGRERVQSGCPATRVAAGGYHSLALGPGGRVVSWGMNGSGQVGDGSFTDRLEPTVVTDSSGLGAASSVAGGLFHSLALGDDGQVWAWGENGNGQLGDGGAAPSPRPLAVAGLAPASAVAAGWYHSLALTRDGQVWAWGNNFFGQLGDGTMVGSSLPVAVAGLAGPVVAIAAGGFHSLALLADGRIQAWGFNGYGQLGDGSFGLSPVPVTATLPAASALAAGGFHSLAVATSDTVWAWGFNGYGQLGTGTFSDSALPVELPALAGMAGVASREQTSLAWSRGGTAHAWGFNLFGQLGDSTTAPSLVPLRVPGLAGVVEMAAGNLHTLARDGSGTLTAWGFGRFGQRGDGSRDSVSAPTEIPFVALPCASNQPPEVLAGGDYESDCNAAQLDAAQARDPEGEELSYRWRSDDPRIVLSAEAGTLPPAAGMQAVPAGVATLADGIAACGVDAEVELEVTDAAGATVSDRARVRFSDTRPPDITPSSAVRHCLWPPNHQYVCFGRDRMAAVVSDSCSAVASWRFTGCASNQPDDDTGDGRTGRDCVVADDGASFCVRAERSGQRMGGRRYTVTAAASDVCGNISPETTIGVIYVPHAAESHQGCIAK